MYIANKFFDNNKTYIMGILNVTPDSFSDALIILMMHSSALIKWYVTVQISLT